MPWEEISWNSGRTLTYPPQRNIKSKLDLARPNNKDSPSSKRQQELRAELGQIRTQQQSSKSSRGQVMDKVKRLDETLKSRIAELKSRIPTGGLREGLVRGLLHVGMARGRADERGLAALRGLRTIEDDKPRPTLSEFKALVREQYYMLLIDQEATLAAIPDLLPRDREVRRKAFAALRQVLNAAGEVTGEAAQRLERIAGLFGVEADAAHPTVTRPRLATAS